MRSKTKTFTLFLLSCLFIKQTSSQSRLIAYDHYWSIRPLSLLTFNPNFQFGSRLPRRDTLKRLYSELSLTYPLGKTYFDRSIYVNNIDARLVALQVEQRFRFVGRHQNFWGPVFEVDYRRIHYLNAIRVASDPDVHQVDFRLGFENGGYILSRRRQIMTIYWGFAARYSYDLDNKYLRHAIGDKEINRWGIKLYLNWQIGQGIRSKYPRKY